MKAWKMTAAAFAALAALSGCGYNIVMEPSPDSGAAAGKPAPIRVAVRDVVLDGQDGGPDADKAGLLVDALRKTNAFKDVQRVGPNDPVRGFDAVVAASYKDMTEASTIGFVFPPCLIPFVDFCIVPLGQVGIDLGGELRAAVADANGRQVKSYDETSKGECSYLPFPGLFPFNLALIAPETACHVSEGPKAGYQAALAKVVADVVRDRAAIVDAARGAAETRQTEQAGDTPATDAIPATDAPKSAAPQGKPWWQQ
ncbi:MAG TPA: hypothetical protein VH309_06210 [Elusimicrobiota bacterium]|jgi:hypothetical protein|nr:hypothetical protein [Elusimicrobiota bacterium]